MTSADLETLRRRPDVEAPELVAVDAADRLLLDTAADQLLTGDVAIINDQYGALTLGTALLRNRSATVSDTAPITAPITATATAPATVHRAPALRVFQDGLVHERALALNAAQLGLQGSYRQHPLGASLLEGVSTVLLRLPRSLDELDELAHAIATFAPPHVRVLAVGRVKHMSLSMNSVLGRHFGSVTAGLARQKSRVLHASGPRSSDAPGFPRSAHHDVGLDRAVEVRAFGATFGGAALDPGTRLLLPHLRRLSAAGPASMPGSAIKVPSDIAGGIPTDIPSGIPTYVGKDGPAEIIDLGSGNGIIASVVALMHPDARVHASDQSSSAVLSTSATAAANGVSDRVRVTRDDALSAVPDGSARAVVLNPPFHIGSTIHTGIAHKLFRECARVLVPGGELLTVWNSHLGYRPVLERFVGPTVQLDRSPRFTVTLSVRSSLTSSIHRD